MFIWYYFEILIPQFPDYPTRFPEEWILIPRSPRNEKIAFLDSPIPRGMKSAGELTALGRCICIIIVLSLLKSHILTHTYM